MLENKRLLSQSVSNFSTVNSAKEDNFKNKIVLTPKKIVLIDRTGLGYLERQDGWSIWSFLAHSGH